MGYYNARDWIVYKEVHLFQLSVKLKPGVGYTKLPNTENFAQQNDPTGRI